MHSGERIAELPWLNYSFVLHGIEVIGEYFP